MSGPKDQWVRVRLGPTHVPLDSDMHNHPNSVAVFCTKSESIMSARGLVSHCDVMLRSPYGYEITILERWVA